MKYSKIINLSTLFKVAAEEEADFTLADMESLEGQDQARKDERNGMEEKLIQEAKSANTALDRLAAIAKMKKKFALPAMRTLISIFEQKQEPLYDYVRDMLNGRIPKHAEEFARYTRLKKDFDRMSEEDVVNDPYNTVGAMFTLWSKALIRAASQKDVSPEKNVPVSLQRTRAPRLNDMVKEPRTEIKHQQPKQFEPYQPKGKWPAPADNVDIKYKR